jgi:hypothetical protein
MDWLTVFGLTAVGLIVLIALLRAERRALWVVVVCLVAPGIILVAGWATLFGHWDETIAGLGLAAVIVAAWWYVAGRRLARPDSDSIKVWGQEKLPKPSPQEAAAMRAELQRLRQDKEALEAEVRRLKNRRTDEGGEPPSA